MKKLIVLVAIALSFSKLFAQEEFKSITIQGSSNYETELLFDNIQTKSDANLAITRLKANNEVIEAEFFDLKSQRIRLVSTRKFSPAEIRELLSGSGLVLNSKCLKN